MPTDYLLIDDEADAAPLLRGLFEPVVTIDAILPERLEDLVGKIAVWLQSDRRHPGILLDWRLRQGNTSTPTGAIPHPSTIAQELRSAATDGALISTPIVVVSSLARLAPTWHSDETGHDLFDAQILKDQIQMGEPADAAKSLLLALGEGYTQLRGFAESRSTLTTVLAWPSATIPFDVRIQAAFEEGDSQHLDTNTPSTSDHVSQKPRPAHEYARFILREVLDTPGPVVNEIQLAATLGVDRGVNASPEWARLLGEHLLGAEYRGPFSGRSRCWWLPIVEDWWVTNVDDARRSPRAYDAPTRVQMLRAKTRLDGLKEAEPIELGYSRRYTTICEVLKRPLDPVNGLRILTREPKSWQSATFVSEYAVRQRLHTPRYRIHPADAARAKQLQQEDTATG